MPTNRNPYFRLMRLHQPVGIWLLFWPGAFAITLASEGTPDLWLLFLFAAGSLLMRAAGCIINDIVDRDIDGHVERTRHRPLASGELKVPQALMLLAVLLTASLAIALLLGSAVLFWSALALPLVAAYPFMKRITWWPQLFLGLTFNWGALLGWIAVHGAIEPPALLIYIGSVFWTLGYDTIYGHQDKVDDAKIGIKSTARKLGDRSLFVVGLWYGMAIALWALSVVIVHGVSFVLITLAFAAGHLYWQIHSVNLDDPESCRQRFASNARAGFLIWLVFLAAGVN
jgi:4-hydroxybenzoate polyprenyltransferase